MNVSETTYRRALYFLILALLGPALLINLGTLTLIDDEALRAWVALEMQLTDHYVVPKLHGDFYYKKPPVYNWVLLGFFQLLGRMDEWAIRIPTVVFLLAYAGTIFYFVRKHFGFHFAFLAAMMLVCCGRILFYDSFLGLIDISYSLVTFLSFMVIFHAFEREQWLRLFAVSYALAAVGFLMKGLPSVVFQGATLLVYFVAQRAFRRLFTWQHVVGGLVFLLLVGGYYYAYAQHNELEKVFAVMFNESAKRTPGRYSVWFTIGHLLAYPFELLFYHFLPWGLAGPLFAQAPELVLAARKPLYPVLQLDVRCQRFGLLGSAQGTPPLRLYAYPNGIHRLFIPSLPLPGATSVDVPLLYWCIAILL